METMPQEICTSALFPPQGPPSVVGRLGREKRKRARATSPRACYFLIMDTKREPLRMREVSATIGGAEMIRNRRRTLFIQVRIDLEARLIITLLFKCEVESLGDTAQMKPLR